MNILNHFNDIEKYLRKHHIFVIRIKTKFINYELICHFFLELYFYQVFLFPQVFILLGFFETVLPFELVVVLTSSLLTIVLYI